MRADETGLTRVSLQLRAVQALAPLYPERARELFEWIDPNLVVRGCADALAPAVDEYYSTLRILARTTFPADAEGRGAALQFFETYLWRAHLPSEIPAVVRALIRYQPTRDEAAHLETTFILLLEANLRDPRGFSIAAADIVSKSVELEEAYRALGLTGWHVVRALRAYMVAQLTAPRCVDGLTDGPAVDQFNAFVRRRELFLDGIQVLSGSEVRSSRLLGVARIDPYWRTPDSRRLFDEGLRLRGTGKNPVPEKERNTPEWLERARHLVLDLEEWTGLREPTEADYFYEKSVLYTLLIDLTPPGAMRARVLRSFGESLRRAEADRVGRALWFAFANRLLELTNKDDRTVVLDLLDQSPHLVLSLYGRLDRLLTVQQADR